MPLDEIFAKATANDVISELKSCRFIPQPDVEQAEKALNPKRHDINDPVKRKDKRVKVDADDDAESAQKVITVDGESCRVVLFRQSATVQCYTGEYR